MNKKQMLLSMLHTCKKKKKKADLKQKHHKFLAGIWAEHVTNRSFIYQRSKYPDRSIGATMC
jgi:hypothetical protein